MKCKMKAGRKFFLICNTALLLAAALSCLLPMVHVLAVSFSSKAAAGAGVVKFLPVDFTLSAYGYVASKIEFWRSIMISVKRVFLGVSINMLLTILTAYPLSKEASIFKSRNVYVWFFVITMLFGGGLIPSYMVIQEFGLMNSIWALILPGAVPVFNVVILMNFFRELPKEIEEAAFIDGAGYLRTLLHIYLPLSKPALATLFLFCTVGHWNAWFDGLIYMNETSRYPLQSYLQTVIVDQDLSLLTLSSGLESFAEVSNQTNRAAQIFLSIIPILCVYPFLQKYFTTGIVLGGVKG